MNKHPLFLNAASWTVAIALMTASWIPARAQNAGSQYFKDSFPAVVPHLRATGRPTPETRMNLSIGLPLRNETALNNLLSQLYDSASPNYRHYLTPQQFVEQFAPSASDYQAVASFFGTNGFAVVQHPDRMVLDVSGPVTDVERVFHLTMRTYKHPKENRDFFAPDGVPSLNLSVPILHISGLNDYAVKQSKIRKTSSLKRPTNAVARAAGRQTGPGSGPDGGYMGNDFRAAYIPGVSLTGAGQTVGLLEYDGYYSSDITTYEGLAGVSVPLVNVPVDGGVSSPGDGDDEVSLDIEVAMSIAPGLTQIVVYEAPATASWEDLLDAMANDTTYSPKQFSCSWGDSSPDVPNVTAENIFKQMDAQGQTFYNAAGDGDAFLGGIPFPSESTNITEVGGTTVNTTGPGGAWVSETVWDWGGAGLGDNSVGSSGGLSENYSIPSWQTNINMTANEGSSTVRNVPDVAMTADNVFIEYGEGSQETVGGTSCAAPAWAAFTALANEQAADYGEPSVGFAAPTIYAAAKSTSYLADFNDITTGNNFWCFSVTSFPAVPGYDLCTGWGTPAGDNLIDMLAGVADPLKVAPGKGFVAFGPAGGGFSANTLTFSLTNSGSGSLNWSLISTSSWLTASVSSGMLPAHATAQATISLNASADTLPAGTYIGGVLFSNQTSHAVRTREFVLVAEENLVENGGFEEYPDELPNWAQTGGIGMYDELPYPSFDYDFVDDGTITEFAGDGGDGPHSGDCFCVFGTAGTYGYISQNIATVPGQSYALSFWLMNAPDGTPTERFVVNWNANGGSANTVYSFSDTIGFDWSNVVVNVTAISTNTVLQFGARSDQSQDSIDSLLEWGNYFGLDDVALMPLASINNPAINVSITQAGPNTVALTWNSVSGQEYQVQYSTSLRSPNWITVSAPTATGLTLSVNVTRGSNPQGYYRIVAE